MLKKPLTPNKMLAVIAYNRKREPAFEALKLFKWRFAKWCEYRETEIAKVEDQKEREVKQSEYDTQRETRESELQAMLDMFTEAEEILQTCIAEYQSGHAAAYQRGLAKGKAYQHQDPSRYGNREGYRASHELHTVNRWADHY